MSAFERGAFLQDVEDIETGLGFLRGNELAHQTYLDHVLAVQASAEGPVLPMAFDYATPCPVGRYVVTWSRVRSIDVPPGVRDPEGFVRELKSEMDQAWRRGGSLMAGVAGRASRVCSQFTEPDASALVGAMDLLQSRVVNKLALSANDDWANLGRSSSLWKGEFAGEFNIFYDNYNEVIARFGLFTSWVNLGYALATKIIAGAQLGAGEFATSMRTNLVSQLDHWADAHGAVPSDPPDPAKVGDVRKLVDDTISLASKIPVVGEIAEAKGMVEKSASVLGDINKLLGGDGSLLPEKKSYAEVMSADEAEGIVQSTFFEFYQAFSDGMDQLDSGGAGASSEERSMSGRSILAMMRDTKDRGDWGLPTVPAVDMA